jgi:hypothetical protein
MTRALTIRSLFVVALDVIGSDGRTVISDQISPTVSRDGSVGLVSPGARGLGSIRQEAMTPRIASGTLQRKGRP